MNQPTLYRLCVVLGLGITGAASARGPRKPPAEAFAACEGKSKGDECAFKHRDHEISGVCEAPPEGDALACRPNHPPGRRPGPPPGSAEACDGKAEGADCAVDMPDHTMEGVCRLDPHGGEELFCLPDGPPPPRE